MERRPLQKKKKEKSHKMPAKNPCHHRQPTDEPLAQLGNHKKGKERRTPKRKPRDRKDDSDDDSSLPSSPDDPSKGSESEDTSSDSNNSSLDNSSTSSSSSSTDSSAEQRQRCQRCQRQRKHHSKKKHRKKERWKKDHNQKKTRCPTVPDKYEDEDTSVGNSKHIYGISINEGKINQEAAPDLMRPLDYTELYNSAIDVTSLPGRWAPKYG
jgi:hypothetical protein